MKDPQCSMPAFEGLFPAPHDALVQELLFVLGTWHGVAKLRLHTEHTLDTLQDLTQTFGTILRQFHRTTCEVFATLELPKEAASRIRRSAKSSNAAASTSTSKATPSQQKKCLNLNTYKLHAMGDYVSTIRQYGTIDSYSTQAVSNRIFSNP